MQQELQQKREQLRAEKNDKNIRARATVSTLAKPSENTTEATILGRKKRIAEKSLQCKTTSQASLKKQKTIKKKVRVKSPTRRNSTQRLLQVKVTEPPES